MVLQFATNEITTQLAQLASVVNSKNTLPILDNVLFDVKDNVVRLTASDGDTWLSVRAEVNSHDVEMHFCINASDFLKALKNLDDTIVTIELDETKHIATCNYGNGFFKMPYEDGKGYPMPQMDMGGAIQKIINSKRLLQAIEKVGFAIANDELRPVMNGVHFDFFKDAMVSVSSDGCKLAKYKDVSITHEAEETYSFTLPRKPSNIAMTMLSSMDMDVKLAFTDKCVVMSNENFKLTSRLIEGRFPKYESVIPKEYKFDAKVDKKTIISALKRVLPMGSQASELVSFKIGGNKMVIAAEDFDFSKSATETITCDYDERKDPITIGFKGSVLMQVLSNLDGDDVVMELTEPSRAAVIYDNDKDKYLSLIMPMLVS